MDPLMQELEKTAKLEQTEQPKPKSKTRLLIAGGLIAVVASAAGAYVHFRDRVSTDDAQVDAHVAPIAPEVGGNSSEIRVHDNQKVKAGAVLVRIDRRDSQAKVAQARAALAAAQSQAVGARVGVPLANLTTASGTSAAEAQVAAATAD